MRGESVYIVYCLFWLYASRDAEQCFFIQIRETVQFDQPFGKPTRGNAAQEDGSSGQNSQGNGQAETQGGYVDALGKYVWLARDSQLTVTNASTGECVSTWTFSERITSVSSFPAQLGEIPLLLVGLDNYAIRIKDSVGQLCVFDSSISMILRTIQVFFFNFVIILTILSNKVLLNAIIEEKDFKIFVGDLSILFKVISIAIEKNYCGKN